MRWMRRACGAAPFVACAGARAQSADAPVDRHLAPHVGRLVPVVRKMLEH